MALRKCPRCELNYILDDGSLCTVCREEVHGKAAIEDVITLCSVCGDSTALPGQDMCKACLSEFQSIEMSPTGTEDEDTSVDDAIDPQSISDLEDLEPIEEDDDDALDDDALSAEDSLDAEDDDPDATLSHTRWAKAQ